MVRRGDNYLLHVSFESFGHSAIHLRRSLTLRIHIVYEQRQQRRRSVVTENFGPVLPVLQPGGTVHAVWGYQAVTIVFCMVRSVCCGEAACMHTNATLREQQPFSIARWLKSVIIVHQQRVVPGGQCRNRHATPGHEILSEDVYG